MIDIIGAVIVAQSDAHQTLPASNQLIAILSVSDLGLSQRIESLNESLIIEVGLWHRSATSIVALYRSACKGRIASGWQHLK